MAHHSSDRIGKRITQRISQIVSDCHYASRRSVQRNTPWLARPTSTEPRS